MVVYFVRHGESEANAQGIAASMSDSPLTEQGKEQAHKIVQALRKKKGGSRVISSGLSRARKTAEIIAQELGLELEIWEDLHEVDIGELSGKPYDKRKENLLRLALRSKSGESLDEIHKRANKVLRKIQKLDKDQNVIVVSHSSFIAMVFAALENVPKEQLLKYRDAWKRMEVGEVRELLLP